MSETLPISEALKVLDHKTLYKTDKWWSAVALLDSFGRKQIVVYLWIKKNEKWTRKQKFVVRSATDWEKTKGIIEEFLPRLS